jgi:hypothetical protein
MAMKSTTVFVSGKVYWAKIVGDKALTNNYEGTGREWTFEFEPDDVSFLKDHRLLDRLKDPMAYANQLEERGEDEKAEKARESAKGRGDYLLIKKAEFNKDGEKNPPFKIVDSDNQPWGEDRLIGNGSTVDLKLNIIDWGAGKKKSIWCSAIRVQDLVVYETDEFAGMDGPSAPKPAATKVSKPKTKAAAEEFADLDDDIPFN